MRVLFIWTGVTTYMADCWRALRRCEDMELKIVIEPSGIGKEFDAKKVMAGLEGEWVKGEWGKGEGAGWKPDVLFAVGWHSKLVREIVLRKDWRDVPKVCCFDMPWRWSLRCLAARFVLHPFLRHYAAAYVPGDACSRYARWLHFPKVRMGLFGIDMARFSEGAANGARMDFLFVGRKVAEKGVDTLRTAHERYLRRGGTWALSVPEWIDPVDVPRTMREHACLVLPSLWEPWGVVVAEAKAAGMRVIASDRVGARLDIPCDAVFPAGDANALANRMLDIEWATARGEAPTAPDLTFWDASCWARRVVEIATDLKSGGVVE